MIDYDMPFMEFDLQSMRKQALTVKDSEGNEFIRYKELLEMTKPRKVISHDLRQLEKLVTKVQAAWRGYQQRKQYMKMMTSDLKKVGM